MNIDTFTELMSELHGLNDTFASDSKLSKRYDSFMDFHPTLVVDDLDPLATLLLRDNIPFYAFDKTFSPESQGDGYPVSLFVQLPRALIVEIVGASLTVATTIPVSAKSYPCSFIVIHLVCIGA